MVQEAAPRNEFAPPPSGGKGRALTLALLAHLLLVLALAWGLNWRRESSDAAVVQAELWSAPPPPVRTAPHPTPPPAPRPAPEPTPQPSQADIALEQQRKAEAERQAAERAEQQRQQELQRQQAAEQARLQQEAEKQAAEKKAAEEAQRKQEQEEEAARQAAAEKQAKAEADRKAAVARQKAELDRQRKAELDRLRKLAGGDSGAASTSAGAGGPSAGYGGKVRAAVRPNIVFPDQIDGNPVAEVEVSTAPDGTITGRRLLKSSGVKSWDDAVLKAIDKTQIMPRDIDGRVPSPMIIEFRPRDR